MKAVIVLFALALALLLGIVDRLTGFEMGFSIFYLIPVVLCAWFINFLSSFIVAVVCASIWMVADISAGHVYSHAWIPLWNTLMRLLIFTIILGLIDRLKSDLRIQKQLTLIDDLTKIGNRRSFYEEASRELNRASRYGRPFCIAFLDVDNFKMINDTAGHKAADELLKKIAQNIREILRTTDVVARLGGDEFGIILVETAGEQASLAAERIKARIIEIALKTKYPITVSIGVAIFQDNLYPSDVDESIKMADQLMYQAKNKGKNSIVYGTFRKPGRA